MSGWHGASVSSARAVNLPDRKRRDFLTKNNSEGCIEVPKKRTSKSPSVPLLSHTILENDRNQAIPDDVSPGEDKVSPKDTNVSPKSNQFTTFWDMEETKTEKIPSPSVPSADTLRSSNRYTSSKVLLSQMNEASHHRMDEFTHEQLRETFVSRGALYVELKYVYRAWDIVKKLCELVDWISVVLGRDIGLDIVSQCKNGALLCEIINKVKPGSVNEVFTDSNFGILENLSRFLSVCGSFDMNTEMHVSDLLCDKNLPNVIDFLHEMAMKANSWNETLPKLREKLPNSKYSSHETRIAVDYIVNHMRYTEDPKW